ncbi:MAG: flagellin lysine-N-methylase [Clostridiales bacterium]|nr:flagellin lysine-N-methylase [Clostridiales bacterium]
MPDPSVPVFVPEYYRSFHCIADRCRHSCCIGWEIDIDPDSLARYRELIGAPGKAAPDNTSEASEKAPAGASSSLSKKLRNCIEQAEDGSSHFILQGKEELCPFLNDQNLCELILEFGEDSLCNICRDHPRFRNFFSDHEEMGLGLCCEEAARLILTSTGPSVLPPFSSENADEQDFYNLRASLWGILNARGLTLSGRIGKIYDLLGISPITFDPTIWGEFLQTLERLDPAWDRELYRLGCPSSLSDFRLFMLEKHRALEYENLLAYFLYRHLPGALLDGRFTERAVFSLLSITILEYLGASHFTEKGDFTLDDQNELVRMYSSEIEYSDENVDLILDKISEVCKGP